MEEKKFLNKVIFVFFALKEYSRSFYFNEVLAIFLGLEHVICAAVYGRVRKVSNLIKNILICVLKMNEGLMGLERHDIHFEYSFSMFVA